MRVFNKRYWPHQARIATPVINREITIEDLERFCYDNFKSSDWRNIGWYFVFKRSVDYTFFMLKWT